MEDLGQEGDCVKIYLQDIGCVDVACTRVTEDVGSSQLSIMCKCRENCFRRSQALLRGVHIILPLFFTFFF